MSAMQRRKGKRAELELVNLHKEMGIYAERVPLSGASHYQSSNHDIDIYVWGKNLTPFCCEVKARGNGGGFTTLEKWLGENDALFLRRNNADPVVVLPWKIWETLVSHIRAGRREEL